MNDKPKVEASFTELMGDVKRLNNSRINVYQDRVKSISPKKQAQAPDSMLDYSTISYQNLSEIDESYFNSGIQKRQQKKIRQGIIAVDDHIDLHGCNQQRATTALLEFVDHALTSQFRFLIVVHGKGSRSDKQAVLKPLVHHLLSQQPMVLAWCPAQPIHGGNGASYVYLKILSNE